MGGKNTGCQSPICRWVRGSMWVCPWNAKKIDTSTAKNIVSPARAEKTKKRMRRRSSLGLLRSFFESSSPPPPPPPVGRRSTGGLPPIPGSFRSVSAGVWVKVAGMGGLCDDEITPTLVWKHPDSEGNVSIRRRDDRSEEHTSELQSRHY